MSDREHAVALLRDRLLRGIQLPRQFPQSVEARIRAQRRQVPLKGGRIGFDAGLTVVRRGSERVEREPQLAHGEVLEVVDARRVELRDALCGALGRGTSLVVRPYAGRGFRCHSGPACIARTMTVMADVICIRCGNTRAGAGRVLPGKLGDEIEGQVCAVCWSEWTQQQIRVINHYGLQPVRKEDREKLYAFTRDFFGLQAEDAARQT